MCALNNQSEVDCERIQEEKRMGKTYEDWET